MIIVTASTVVITTVIILEQVIDIKTIVFVQTISIDSCRTGSSNAVLLAFEFGLACSRARS